MYLLQGHAIASGLLGASRTTMLQDDDRSSVLGPVDGWMMLGMCCGTCMSSEEKVRFEIRATLGGLSKDECVADIQNTKMGR